MFLKHAFQCACHHSGRQGSANRQRGFAIISALFILVALAMLSRFIVQLSTMQQIGSVLDLKGAQAYQAAAAGIEVGLAGASAGACPGSNSFAVDSMMVTVTCASTPAAEAGVASTLYVLRSTACSSAAMCPGDARDPNYVERRLTVNAEF